jgi:shikimate kinase
MKNILLIGYRCTGKSSAGKRLAGKMGMSFLDTDDLIVEKAGISIRQIVEIGGWNLFRKKEKEVVEGLKDSTGSVIATGGGIFDDRGNRSLLRTSGIFFLLTADRETIIERVMYDRRNRNTRPSLVHDDLSRDVIETLERREPIYREMADFTIDTSRKSVDTVVDEIYGLLKAGR